MTTATADAKHFLEVAEKLLAARDFVTSRRLAIRALDADPLVDGVDQVLAVADVLLATEKRVKNSQNWYAILGIDQQQAAAADLAAIKRKYRKLALLLHPDKSKCFGAEAAFQFVSDAWSVLSDPAKRALFDRELAATSVVVTGGGPAAGNFWTGCPSCYHIHEYSRMYQDRQMKCPKCRATFKAEEVKSHPQLAPGMNAYYFNWGYCQPTPAGGQPAAGYGTPGPSPFVAVNPTSTVPSSAPATNPVTPMDRGRGRGRGRGGGRGSPADISGGPGSSSVAARSGEIRRGRGRPRKDDSVSTEKKPVMRSRVSPDASVEEMTGTKVADSGRQVRQSPRFKAGTINYKEDEDEEDEEEETDTGEEEEEEEEEEDEDEEEERLVKKTPSKRVTRRSTKNPAGIGEANNMKMEPENGLSEANNGEMKGSSVNGEKDPVAMMESADISDILSALPKIYNDQGEEVQIKW